MSRGRRLMIAKVKISSAGSCSCVCVCADFLSHCLMSAMQSVRQFVSVALSVSLSLSLSPLCDTWYLCQLVWNFLRACRQHRGSNSSSMCCLRHKLCFFSISSSCCCCCCSLALLPLKLVQFHFTISPYCDNSCPVLNRSSAFVLSPGQSGLSAIFVALCRFGASVLCLINVAKSRQHHKYFVFNLLICVLLKQCVHTTQ